jgi:hypothetical protein
VIFIFILVVLIFVMLTFIRSVILHSFTSLFCSSTRDQWTGVTTANTP